MVTFVKVLFLFVTFTSCQNVNPRYYPRYHLAPPHGWMNDPNGFCVFKNEYHLFYQYNPVTSQNPGIAHWGHAKSKDLMNWEHLPIAMYPDQSYDRNGVFSGSAIVENDTMYIYYTAHVNHPDQVPNHEEHQAFAFSNDGVTVEKYHENPVIEGEDMQPDFRDPKVWKHGDSYYMVLGHSINNTFGEALLYKSKDRINWEKASVLGKSDGSLGFMWECPDFFELDGSFVLLFSPQGLKPNGDDYKNLYQTGYIVGQFDYDTNEFHTQTDFVELDHGHDFYATQTLDDDGRRVLIAWMDMWEKDEYPERDDGFTGMMTLPRVLHLTLEGKLIQTPVNEVINARGEMVYEGKANDESYTLNDKSGLIEINAPQNEDLTVEITSDDTTVIITYNSDENTVTLDRGGEDPIRRTKWSPEGDIIMNIYIDASSIELFCGNGELTFSSRFFPNDDVEVQVQAVPESKFKIYDMKRTVPVPPL